MKKIYVLVAIPLAVVSVAVFAVSAKAQAQQAQTLVCPAGYSCTQVPVSNCYAFNINLEVGSAGADVSAMQDFLLKAGYHIPVIEEGDGAKGMFGPQTLAALKKYQKSEGIDEDGFGPMTRASMVSSCTSVAVTGAQAIIPTSQIQAPGQASVLSMTFPSNTIKSLMSLSCPVGVSIVPAKNNADIHCNTLFDTTNMESIKFTMINTNPTSVNAVVDYYIYTSDSPNYAKEVWASITVQPVGAPVNKNNASIWDAINKFFGL